MIPSNSLSQDDDPHTDDRVSTVTKPSVRKSAMDGLRKLCISQQTETGDFYMRESQRCDIEMWLLPEDREVILSQFRLSV